MIRNGFRFFLILSLFVYGCASTTEDKDLQAFEEEFEETETVAGSEDKSDLEVSDDGFFDEEFSDSASEDTAVSSDAEISDDFFDEEFEALEEKASSDDDFDMAEKASPEDDFEFSEEEQFNTAETQSPEVPPGENLESPQNDFDVAVDDNALGELPPDLLAPEMNAAVPSPAPPQASSGNALKPLKVLNIEYLAKENGKILITTSRRPEFQVRQNQDINQMIIDIPNADLPSRLERPFSLQDFNSPVGAMTAYQDRNSGSTRILVQLKDGAQAPSVKDTEDGILIDPEMFMTEAEINRANRVQPLPLAGQTLEDFLSSDPKFYGKPVSIQVKNADVSDVINLIAEESGANIVQDGVEGKISLKLRQIPWDQALVIIMRSKKLGYTRQGNVLRVASLDALQKEAQDAKKMRDERIAIEPLFSEVIAINYAGVEELGNQIKPFLSPRGSTVADIRTNSLVVTDTQAVVKNVKALISGLDITPPQVLIEAKVVEARDSFSRQVGFNWGAAIQDTPLGQTGSGLPFNANIAVGARRAVISGGLNSIPLIGDLNFTLALAESQDKVKVISAPRIQTLHNRESTISSEIQIPIQQSIIPQGGAGVQQQIEFRPIRLELKVKPLVTTDQTVILDVNIIREFLGTAQEGQAPINTRTANTQVLVGDGKTAVIGGIYTSDVTMGTSGFPGLKDLPFLGNLFRTNQEATEKSELLLFLTPRVMSGVN